MINEICQFVKDLEETAPQIFEEGESLKEGVYTALDIGLDANDGKSYLQNANSEGKIFQEDIRIYTKKTEIDPFFKKCRQIMNYSQPVSAAKIFNPNKKIFNVTCSPYIIGFSKKILDKNLETIGQVGVLKELTGQYFKKAEEFIEDSQSHIRFESLRKYLSNHFWSLLNQIGYDELKDSYSIIIMLKKLSVEDYKIPYKNT
jgi:CRISPR-associated protein Csh1